MTEFWMNCPFKLYLIWIRHLAHILKNKGSKGGCGWVGLAVMTQKKLHFYSIDTYYEHLQSTVLGKQGSQKLNPADLKKKVQTVRFL